MVIQIIEEGPRKLTTGQKLGAGFQQALGVLGAHQQQEKQFAQQMKLQEMKGKQALAEKLAGRTPTAEERRLEDQRYNTIKSQWGDEAADLYRAAPEGGKTELIKQMIDMQQRGINVSQALKSIGPEGEKPDEDFGYNPKEKVELGKERYKTNLPLYEEASTKMRAYEDESTALNILEDLSPQISGIHRLNINPSSGELLVPALASPEAQRFVKTINDFTTKAKDSYGSRVTNFDLTQFMKRLPTLANSEEGRKQILDQMRLLNEINLAKYRSLINYVEEHGGVRNVDWDKAQREADKRSKPIVDEYKKQFTKIESASLKSYDKSINEKKNKAHKKGMVLMELNGENIFVPKSDVAKAKKKGARAL